MASMPLHHGVVGHPHILGCAPLAGYQVLSDGGLACELVPYLLGSSSLAVIEVQHSCIILHV